MLIFTNFVPISLLSDEVNSIKSVGKHSSFSIFRMSPTLNSCHLDTSQSPFVHFKAFLQFSSLSDFFRFKSSSKSFIALTVRTNSKGIKILGMPPVTDI